MKTEALGTRNWDDLVFENRHKEYGAYAVRQAYPRHMTMGLMATVTAALLIIFVPRLFPNAPAIMPVIPIPTVPTTGLIIEPRIEKPEVKPPVAETQIPKGENHQPPQVTRNEVTEPTPTVEQLSASPAVSSPDGVEGAVAPTVGVVDGTGTTEVPVVNTTKVFDIVEIMPAYEGGMEAMVRFISRNVKYPIAAKRMELEGTVFVSFIINAAGNVSDVKVIRGISAECDKEAARVIAAMPSWKAGIQNGNPVSVRMVIPIKFAFNRN